MADSPPVSILILTLNEEKKLPACLAAVARFDDIVVLDSGSTDRTAAVARAAGARVFVNPFRDFASQRNHAHETIAFKHPWVLHLDADEIMMPELAAECTTLDPAAPLDGYYIAPRMMFHGNWLRRCTDFPAWQARCVRARGFRFIQTGHGQREAPEMRMGRLAGNYLHDISVDDIAEWEARHQRYARQEASQFLAAPETLGQTLQKLLAGAPLARRRALKRLSYHLPARPLMRLLYQYVLRGGFLDGAGAWRYCLLLARYERIAAAEIKRQRAAGHG
ncbi:glycosyltransferase family 2 protein [Opitutus sp. GAS368]|jgi:glycosyltransferase involved in cell wall biosynthesis|uniref:glycosyltransferase family 2 protein n=1 Tax=Opitutus sp. GAS368 TaxID=1882749 RepID=UPI00087D85BF|nr:glycosyltransferase family 2 protein [Opitutus sp. GAS368]SDS64426.1 Glycosyltransferase involved in cell wall bisynthesis [Opitutus sp. GAS368]